jgi:excisionase family DNA binding protein
MSEVALGHVGIVLAIEASRLARNNADWQRLIWFCSMTETLLGDQDGLYDPSLLDDRMVLGLKGTISELEWHTIRKRMREAALGKARRGELEIALPAGMEWDGQFGIRVSADRQVLDTIRLVFEKFDDLGSANQAALYFRDHGIKLPRRDKGGAVRWMAPKPSMVYEFLTHPIYAGAYVYGRRRTIRQIDPSGSLRIRSVAVGRGDWLVLIKDHHEGLISWERFENTQKRLMENYTKAGFPGQGPVREGPALLQGLVYCGKCGRKMNVVYHKGGIAQVVCRRVWSDREAGGYCQILGERRIEEAVVALFLEAVQPAGVEVALRALEGVREEQETISRHWSQCIERAEYEADRARRRYEEVDPANRLVAAELERRWNEALEGVASMRRHAEEQLRKLKRELTDEDRESVRRMAQDIGRIWQQPTTAARDKKRLLRAAIERVVVTGEDGSVKVAIEWKGGEVNELSQQRARRGNQRPVTDDEVVDLVQRLAEQLDDLQIARVLNRRGLKTATGLTFAKRHVQSIRAAHQIPCAERRPLEAEPVYTAEEAARELGVSSTTIHEWLRAGLLRGQQVVEGAPWRIALDEETRKRLAGTDAPEGWVDLREAVLRLGVSKQTVISWVKEGKLRAVRVARGRRTGWRICVESTDLERQRRLF